MPSKINEIYREVFRCAFCGFCEYACPTKRYANVKRQYGPRGRIQIILFALRDGLITEEGVKGIFTCLECNACSLHCPAKINIAEAIRTFRFLLLHGLLKIEKRKSPIKPILKIRG